MQLPRVAEKEGTVQNRKSRVDAILKRAEKFLLLSRELYTQKNFAESRIYRKRAHQEARFAARLIGILEIEFGIAMGPEVERARMIFLELKKAPPPSGERTAP